MKQINTEGLGSTCTVRGTTANRFQGDGYAWGNLEFRIRLVTFDWINQHWALVLNPFMDAGRIVQPYRYDEMKAAAALTANQSPLILANNTPLTLADGSTPAISELLYTGNDEKIHLSAGTGLHVIMNQNFNISFEFAKAFDPQDGLFGMNVGLNYIF